MSAIPFPSLSRSPGRLRFELVSTVFEHVSPYTSASQRVSMAGADAWKFSATWLGLRGRDIDLIEGFYSQLAGSAGTFTLAPWHKRAPSGTVVVASGTLTSSAAQFATSLTISGVGAARTLLVGDLLQLGSQVHRVTADATASGAGQITVNVRSALRLAQSGGAVVTFLQPTITWRLLENTQGIDRTGGGFADVTVEAIEAI